MKKLMHGEDNGVSDVIYYTGVDIVLTTNKNIHTYQLDVIESLLRILLSYYPM